MNGLSDRMDDFEWYKLPQEFLKAGDGLWVSRNNCFTIIRDGRRAYRLNDGWGRVLATATSLKKAIALADER